MQTTEPLKCICVPCCPLPFCTRSVLGLTEPPLLWPHRTPASSPKFSSTSDLAVVCDSRLTRPRLALETCIRDLGQWKDIDNIVVYLCHLNGNFETQGQHQDRRWNRPCKLHPKTKLVLAHNCSQSEPRWYDGTSLDPCRVIYFLTGSLNPYHVWFDKLQSLPTQRYVPLLSSTACACTLTAQGQDPPGLDISETQ